LSTRPSWWQATGVHSSETEERLKAAGVKHVAIPAAGKLSPERQALETGLSLARGHRGAHCQSEARLRLAQKRLSRAGGDGTLAGSGVIASNLRRIALAK